MTQMSDTIKTMLSQLGGSRFLYMVGASDVGFSNQKEYLSLRFKGCKRYNTLRVTYNRGLDIYHVLLTKWSPKRLENTDSQEFENVYAEDLQGLFTRMTGLHTSLH